MKRTKAQIQRELDDTKVQLEQAVETVRMLRVLAKGEDKPVEGQAGDWIPARVAVLVGEPSPRQGEWTKANVRIRVRMPSTEFDVAGIQITPCDLLALPKGKGFNYVQARGGFFTALRARVLRATPAKWFDKAEHKPTADASVPTDANAADVGVPAEASVPMAVC